MLNFNISAPCISFLGDAAKGKVEDEEISAGFSGCVEF